MYVVAEYYPLITSSIYEFFVYKQISYVLYATKCLNKINK